MCCGGCDTTAEGLSGAEASARLVRVRPQFRSHSSGERDRGAGAPAAQRRAGAAGGSPRCFRSSWETANRRSSSASSWPPASALGFVNEYRAERASAALHSAVPPHRRRAPGRPVQTKVDVNHACARRCASASTLGEAVPADVRLIDVNGLECNESILSGESVASEKSLQPVNAAAGLTDSSDLAFMGTIVSPGSVPGPAGAARPTPSAKAAGQFTGSVAPCAARPSTSTLPRNRN